MFLFFISRLYLGLIIWAATIAAAAGSIVCGWIVVQFAHVGVSIARDSDRVQLVVKKKFQIF